MRKIYAGRGATDYYLAQQRRGLVDYYLPEAGEVDAPSRVAPGSAWWGGGARALGLQVGREGVGGITRGVFEPLYSRGIGPSGQPLGQRFRLPEDAAATAADRAADVARIEDPEERWEAEQRLARRMPRPSVAAWDCTFSPVKSVSLLWAGGDVGVQREVWAAHLAAVDAGLDYLERHGAHVRAGRNGVRTHDVTGLVVARMNEFTSRDGDMQLHTHCVVLNRAETVDDGRWRSLDGRSLLAARAGAGALYARTLEAELSRRLGVAWRDRPDGLREIDGVDDGLIEVFSSRRRAITERMQEMSRAWAEQHGFEPPPAVVRAMSQQATIATRRGKNAISPDAAAAGWGPHAAAVGRDLADVPTTVGRAAGRHRAGSQRSREEQVAAVVEALGSSGSATFTEHDAVRAALDVVEVGTMSASELERDARALLDEVRAAGLVVELTVPRPADVPGGTLRRRDGASLYERANRRRWALRATLDREAWLLDVSRDDHDAPSLGPGAIERATRQAQLDGGQAAAVAALVGGDGRVGRLVGPAGSGKTRALRAAVGAWQSSGRPVIGLSVSQAAAEVLAAESGARCENIAKWLHETRTGRWELAPGSLVLVDEASMVDTEHLVTIVDQARRVEGRVVLVGDPAQLSAIGTSGAFELLVDRIGAVELHEVRRFPHDWEAEVSLRLRDGDVTVTGDYNRHGRIHGGPGRGIEQQMLRVWAADRNDPAVAGSLMLASTNDQAARLSARARELLIRTGHLDPGGRFATVREGEEVVQGDVVVTRRNDRSLVTDGGRWVHNGMLWTVRRIHDDGDVTVDGMDGQGRVRLPAGYLSEHVHLGYATTLHRAQGLTVDRAHVLVDSSTSRAALYVGMTRGRDANHAWVVCDDPTSSRDDLDPVTPESVIAGILRREPDTLSAHATIATSAEEVGGVNALAAIHADASSRATEVWLEDQLARRGLGMAVLDPRWRALVLRFREFVASGADPDELLRQVVDVGGFVDVRSIAGVLHWRLGCAAITSLQDPRPRRSQAALASTRPSDGMKRTS